MFKYAQNSEIKNSKISALFRVVLIGCLCFCESNLTDRKGEILFQIQANLRI